MQIYPDLPKVDSFVMTELPVGHVSMVPYNFAHMLWRHVLLLSVHKTEFPLLRVALGLQLLPFSGYKEQTKKTCTSVSNNETILYVFGAQQFKCLPFSCSFSSVM